MLKNNLTFEELPNMVFFLSQEIKELKTILSNTSTSESFEDLPMKIEGVAELTSLKISTLYGYVQRNEIPYHKKGNRLYFFKSEIIDWIKTGKQKTIKELEAQADAYLLTKKRLK